MSSLQHYKIDTNMASIFIDEETKAQNDEGTCPKSHTGGKQGFEPMQGCSLYVEGRRAPTEVTY